MREHPWSCSRVQHERSRTGPASRLTHMASRCPKDDELLPSWLLRTREANHSTPDGIRCLAGAATFHGIFTLGYWGRYPWGLQVHVRNQSCSTSGLLSERQSFGGNAEQRSKAKHVLSTIRSDGHLCGHTRRHVELHNTCSRIGKEGAAPSWRISSWGRTTLVISKSDSR